MKFPQYFFVSISDAPLSGSLINLHIQNFLHMAVLAQNHPDLELIFDNFQMWLVKFRALCMVVLLEQIVLGQHRLSCHSYHLLGALGMYPMSTASVCVHLFVGSRLYRG